MFLSDFTRSVASKMMVALMLTGSLSPIVFAASATLTVEAGADQTLTLGDTLVLDGEAYAQGLDASSIGLTEATIDWGDGTFDDVLFDVSMDAGGHYINGSHVYGGTGDYVVEVCAGDIHDGLTVCDSFTLIVGMPDLVASNLVITETSEGSGLYTVTADYSNIGQLSVDASVGGTITGFVNGVLNTNYNWSTLSPENVAFLATGGENLGSSIFTGPTALTDGDLVEVCLDYTNLVAELDETNNCTSVTFSAPSALPDFFVSDVYAWQFSTESYVQVEDIPAGSDPADYVLYFDVSNQGTDATVVSLTDLKLDLCDVDCSTATLPPYLVEHDFAFLGDSDVLTSGGTSTDNAEEIYTGEVDVSGVTTFEYCVDESDYLLESDESNNCISFDNPFFVSTDGGDDEVDTDPDFVIESVTLNADNTLHFVVSNQGTGTVDTEILVPLYFYDQTNGDGTPDDSFYLNDYGSDYATVGGTVEFDSMYAVPGLPVTILAVVDPANDVAELTDDVFESNYYRATFGEESSGGGSSGGTVRGGGSSHSSGGSSSSSTTETTPVETTSEEVVLTEEEVAACGEMTFTDVTVDTEGYDAIYQLWCEGVLHGRDAEHFAPNDEVKRDEATKIVTRLFGFVTTAHEDLPQVTETSYSDVSTDEALAYYVETATDEGFFTEEELVGEFRPHEDMTYSEAQSLLANASGREVTVEGYEATDTMTRGVFVDLVLGFFQ